MARTNVVSKSEPSSNASDAELVLLGAQGSDMAFEFIMRRYNRLLFRTARSIVDNDADAEEVLQEAYMHAWQALGRFRAEAKLSTWLVRIVINAALARGRRRGAQLVPLSIDAVLDQPEMQRMLMTNPKQHPDQHAIRVELRTMLEARIDQLPDMYRTVFMLRAVEEMTTAEVAEALQLPEATVRTRFFRARSLLREGLASDVDARLDEVFAFDGERCDRIVSQVLEKIRNGGVKSKTMD